METKYWPNQTTVTVKEEGTYVIIAINYAVNVWQL